MEQDWKIAPLDALHLAVEKAGELMRWEGELLAEGEDWLMTLVIVHPDGRSGVVRGLDDAQIRGGQEKLAEALLQVGDTLPIIACTYVGAAWMIPADRDIEGMPLEQHPDRTEVLRVIGVARSGEVIALRAPILRSEDQRPGLGDWTAYDPTFNGWLLEALRGVVEL
jgi:hypothetical protein